MRVIFMGTPELAVPSLQALLAANVEVAAVVTRPPRPAGRGQRLVPSPVGQAAAAAVLPVIPTARITFEVLTRLREIRPEAVVLVAYGAILPSELLELPPFGCVNVHPSLLPRYRGPSPIAAPILAGDAETGVSIMLMSEQVDAGPVLAQVREPIRPDDTGETLSARLSRLGAGLLLETLPRWVRGELAPVPQDESQATYTRRLTRADGRIDWALPAMVLERQVRGYHPWPGAFSSWEGRGLKVLRASVEPQAEVDEPGRVLGVRRSPGAPSLLVATGLGGLGLELLQLEGKRPQSAAEFVRGYPAILGARLGEAS